MTSNVPESGRILGRLGSAEGKGIVRMEDRLDTDIDDVWSALTDPSRLARWYGEVEGDLRLGGEYRAHLFASGWEGTGRVEACEPPQRLLVRIEDADEPEEHDIEVMLTADGDQTIVVWEERGCPWTSFPLTGPGCSSMLKISPTTSPGVSAATTSRRGGTSSTLPIKTWRPTSANDTSGGSAAWASVVLKKPGVHFFGAVPPLPLVCRCACARGRSCGVVDSAAGRGWSVRRDIAADPVATNGRCRRLPVNRQYARPHDARRRSRARLRGRGARVVGPGRRRRRARRPARARPHRWGQLLALTIDERAIILAQLEDPPDGLAELRAVLMNEHQWRQREGLDP